MNKILLPLALAVGIVTGLGAQTNVPRFEIDDTTDCDSRK